MKTAHRRDVSAMFPQCPICIGRRLVTADEKASQACIYCQRDPEAGRRKAKADVEMDALEREASR